MRLLAFNLERFCFERFRHNTSLVELIAFWGLLVFNLRKFYFEYFKRNIAREQRLVEPIYARRSFIPVRILIAVQEPGYPAPNKTAESLFG
jgi:hypothetical protein